MVFSGVRNPVFSSADGRMIVCRVQFEHLPGWTPFSASADDAEAHGREIHAAAVRGDYGAVGPYVAPVLTAQQKLEAELRARGVTAEKVALALLDQDSAKITELRAALTAAKAEAAK